MDMGAGEGKNAIFLAQRGATVTAIECSEPALANFRKRLRELDEVVKQRITIRFGDVREYKVVTRYDAVIAYGLLHCLPTVSDAERVVELMKRSTVLGGYNVVVTFTPNLPVPSVQSYLHPTLLDPTQLLTWYANWDIRAFEEGVIEETHPTSREVHMHSLCRLLAIKVK